ncbi:MAG: RNA polymerase sigma factor [Blautia sp.]|nr:RNA polymerase sigma factor [Blautia sp.]
MDNSRFDECMNRIRGGDKEALKEIYESCQEYIFHLMYSITGNYSDAEDLSVEFFLKLWDIADKYTPGGGYRRWLTVIARNLALDFLRRNQREIALEAENIEQELEKHSGDDPGYEKVLDDISIEQALAGLSPAEREIVHLKVAGELTFQNIADILKVPMGTVTWRYRQAVGKLRRCGYEAL